MQTAIMVFCGIGIGILACLFAALFGMNIQKKDDQAGISFALMAVAFAVSCSLMIFARG